MNTENDEENENQMSEDDYDSEFTLNGKAPQTLFSQSEDENVIYIIPKLIIILKKKHMNTCKTGDNL